MKPSFDDAESRLTTDCAKNYCNRTPIAIVEVIVENVVTCFFMGHSV